MFMYTILMLINTMWHVRYIKFASTNPQLLLYEQMSKIESTKKKWKKGSSGWPSGLKLVFRNE